MQLVKEKLEQLEEVLVPAYEDKVGRRSIRVMDLRSEKNLRSKIRFSFATS